MFFASCTSLNKNKNDLDKDNKDYNPLEKIDLKSNNKLEKYKSQFGENKTNSTLEYSKNHERKDMGSSLAKDVSASYRNDLMH